VLKGGHEQIDVLVRNPK